MKRKQEPNKLYYNVNISYDPFSLGENKFSSKAETSIELIEPLIENPGDYNLSISKFRIDTEAIPIMIAECAQPNTKEETLKGMYKTNYLVEFYVAYYDTLFDPQKKTLSWMSGSAYVSLLRLFSTSDADYIRSGNQQYYHNNLSKDFYIYDYNTFINGVNEAMHNAFLKLVENNSTRLKDIDKTTKRCYFDIEDGKLVYYQHYLANHWGKDELDKKCEIKYVFFKFPYKLYKYFGSGFNCVMQKDGFRLNYTDTQPEKGQYAKIKQAYSTLPNWQCLKALVIGTDTLPVTEEFIPVNRKDGLLNHYVTTENYKVLKDLGIIYETNENVFKKKTQRILTVYYPLSSTAGDTRSCVIHSMENMNDGQSLELLPGEPITKFNIWIKWIDNFNNMHDLEFYEGCGADIRLCFTKKKMEKEDFAEGMGAIVDLLQPKPEKRDYRSTGRNDGISIPGVDKYGFVHI